MIQAVKSSPKSRSKSRQAALQVLYQLDLTETDGGEGAYGNALEAISSELGLDKVTKDYAEHLLKGTVDKSTEIDVSIESSSKNWTMDRMGIVERSVLRLAAFELIFCSKDVPYKVAIDEALELVRRFGSEDSVSFVNGILDNIANKDSSPQV